jgi:hypothetical protein
LLYCKQNETFPPLIIDCLQALSAAAEASSVISVASNNVLSTPTKITSLEAVTSMDRESMTVDYSNLLGKKSRLGKVMLAV